MLGTLDEFTLTAQLAETPVGTAYRALDKQRGREMRIKIAGRAATQLRASPNRLCGLDIEGVLAIEEVRRDAEGAALLIQPHPRAVPLAERLPRYEGDWRQIAHLIRECALSLAQLHEQGVTHGDISEHSVLIDEDGVPVLADAGLGLALHFAEAGDAEKLERKFKLDQRADMFALGCVMYRLLSGQPASQTPAAVLSDPMSTHDDVAPIDTVAPEAPTELRAVCGQLISTDPVHRYLHAELLVRDLEAYLFGKRKKSSVKVALVAIAAATVLLFGLWGTVGGGPARIVDVTMHCVRSGAPAATESEFNETSEALTTDDAFGVTVRLSKAAHVAVLYLDPTGSLHLLGSTDQTGSTTTEHRLPTPTGDANLWPTGPRGGVGVLIIASYASRAPAVELFEGVLATVGQPPTSFAPLNWSGNFMAQREKPLIRAEGSIQPNHKWQSLGEYADQIRRHMIGQADDLVVGLVYVIGA